MDYPSGVVISILYYCIYGIVSAKRDLTHVVFFLKISNFLNISLKCSLHIVSYALRIEVSIVELYGPESLISHIFQRLQFVCAYWMFYNVCVETIPYKN